MTDILTLPAEFLSGKALHREGLAQLAPVDGDENVIEGLLVPYEQRAEIAPDVWEVFDVGAFARAADVPASKVKLKGTGHDPAVIGHALELRETPSGPWGRFRVVDTTAGRDAMALMRAGSIDELSVEFIPDRAGMDVQRFDDGVLVRHSRVKRLLGVSPVPVGAYGEVGAKVLSVRDDRDKAREAAIARLRALTS